MDNVTSQELRDYQYLRQLIGSDEQVKDYVSYARSQMDMCRMTLTIKTL